MSNQTTELAKIDVNEIAVKMKDAGAILEKNENLVNQAEKGGQALLDTIEGGEMSDDIDIALNEWQGKAKQALDIINKRRTPITQIMTKMARFFTELEGKLDPKKTESIYAKIQAKRDEWATKKAKEAKEKADAILRQQNIANEKVSLTAEINAQIRAIYNDKLFTFKKFVTDTYNKLTLENVDAIKQKIDDVKIIYPLESWNLIMPTVFASYMPKADVDVLIAEIRDKLYDECSANFRENMEAHKIETLDLVPSRINELKAIAKSSAAEKERLEAEAENRKRAQEMQALAAKKTQEEVDAKRIEAQKKMDTAGNLFNSSAALQEVKVPTGKVKEAVKINVLDAKGFAAIFMFYFEKEGSGLTVEAFGKKTMLQMVAFCEKKAFKDNETIDSIHLEYVDVYKAKLTK